MTALHFIDPYPGLLAADASGAICLWAVAPTRFPVRHTIVMNLSTMLSTTGETEEGGMGAVISICSAGSILGGDLPGGADCTPEVGKGGEERRGGSSSSSGSNGGNGGKDGKDGKDGNGGKEEGVSLFFGDDKGMVTAWFIPRALLAAAGVDKVGVQRPSTYVYIIVCNE